MWLVELHKYKHEQNYLIHIRTTYYSTAVVLPLHYHLHSFGLKSGV